MLHSTCRAAFAVHICLKGGACYGDLAAVGVGAGARGQCQMQCREQLHSLAQTPLSKSARASIALRSPLGREQADEVVYSLPIGGHALWQGGVKVRNSSQFFIFCF